MAVLPILIAPDPVLKFKAKGISQVDDEIRQLMDDMLETMYHAQGIGLAAPQVGVSQRIIVLDVGLTKEKAHPLKMANPVITWTSEDFRDYEEGCLSFPEHYASVARPDNIRVRYLDDNNQEQEVAADGLMATCIQHEIDHLDGINFVDYLTPLKRGMILKKLKKWKKQHHSSS